MGLKELIPILGAVEEGILPQEMIRWKCPCCLKDIPKGESRWQDEIPRDQHLKVCAPRAPRWKIYLEGQKKFKERYAKNKGKIKTEFWQKRWKDKQERAAKKGHALQIDSGIKQGERKWRWTAFWACSKCRSSDKAVVLNQTCEPWEWSQRQGGGPQWRPPQAKWMRLKEVDEGNVEKMKALYQMTDAEVAGRTENSEKRQKVGRIESRRKVRGARPAGRRRTMEAVRTVKQKTKSMRRKQTESRPGSASKRRKIRSNEE